MGGFLEELVGFYIERVRPWKLFIRMWRVMRFFLLATIDKSKTDNLNLDEADFSSEESSSDRTVRNGKIVLNDWESVSLRCTMEGWDGPAGKCVKLWFKFYRSGFLSPFYHGYQSFFVMEWKTCPIATFSLGSGFSSWELVVVWYGTLAIWEFLKEKKRNHMLTKCK